MELQKAITPKTATGVPIHTEGKFATRLSWQRRDGSIRSAATEIHVLHNLAQPVLSKRTQIRLGMLHEGYPHTALNRVQYAEEPFPNTVATATEDQPAVAPLTVGPSNTVKDRTLKKLMADFPKTFDGECRPMKGPPCHFRLVEGATPVAIRGSRPVAEPLLPRLKEEITALEKQRIIRKVTEPTAWVHPIVVVPKKDKGIRLCVDLGALNKCIVRPRFESQTPFQAVRTIPPGMKFFTVVDALKGYHQVPLDEESAAMTTFSTPVGRYQYLRLPFGVVHAGDDYCRRVADIFDDIPNTRRIVEDILVFSKTWGEHVEAVRHLFARAAEHDVSLNTRKVQFAQHTVKFGGYVVSENHFKPDPELTDAIRRFPEPKNSTDLRAFFGLCQQVGNFSNRISTALGPLAPLLKKGYLWEWTTTHSDAFTNARSALSDIDQLAFYDPAHPTALHVDASRLHGLGFVLKQKKAGDQWRMVQAGSRFLSAAETRYAMIELECLGAAWAMSKCRQFLEGLPHFDLVVDHKPLVPILNDYALDKLDNPRLLRLRLKMQRYAFTARWIPGKDNKDADALSRAPYSSPSTEDQLAEGPASFTIRNTILAMIGGSDAATLDPVLERVKTAAATDPIMQELRELVRNGFPNEKGNLSEEMRPYWAVRSRLAIDDTDGMVVVGARVVIPKSLRHQILRDLLLMHQGATKLRQRARLTIYWPNMDNDITNAARSCDECVSRLPSHQREPLRPHDPASRPFEQVHADLGSVNGRHFLTIVDQFSGWPHVVPFQDSNTTARRLIAATRSYFAGVGAPVKFWSDNGTNFVAAEFEEFLRDWGVSHGRSSPHHPQSNGIAEAGIKQMKKLLETCWTTGAFDEDKFAKGLLLFRNTPRSGGASPAQLVLGRPLRDCLPAHPRSFAPEWQAPVEELEQRTERVKKRRTERYNLSARTLPPLQVGNNVLIQHPVTKRWATPGKIIEIGPNRDYLIKTSSGSVMRRNRRFLRRRVPVMPGASGTSMELPTSRRATQTPPQPAQQPPPVRPRRTQRTSRPVDRFQAGSRK